MLPDLPRNRYPALRGGISVHRTPGHGILFNDESHTMAFISAAVASVLAQCDGTRTFDEILTGYLGTMEHADDREPYDTLVTLSSLVRERIIGMYARPHRVVISVTGSASAFHPTHIAVELTTRCNLHCSYCYNDSDSRQDDILPTPRLLGILGALVRNGLRGIELTGGEPLLHPDFLEIVRFCGERLHLVGLLTNGTLMTEDIVLGLLPYREKMVICVSLDSHVPSVHDSRRGRQGAFKRTTRAIRLLSDHHFLTRVSMSIDESNWRDIEPTLLLARELGATTFTYSPVLPFGRAEKDFRFWTLDAREVLGAEKGLHEKYREFLQILPEESVSQASRPGGCGAGHRTYVMDPRGGIRPCPMFGLQQALLGSLRNQDPGEVFGGGLPRAFARIEPPSGKICGSCPWIWFCQNCVLRGLLGSRWIGEDHCLWLNKPGTREWRALTS